MTFPQDPTPFVMFSMLLRRRQRPMFLPRADVLLIMAHAKILQIFSRFSLPRTLNAERGKTLTLDFRFGSVIRVDRIKSGIVFFFMIVSPPEMGKNINHLGSLTM